MRALFSLVNLQVAQAFKAAKPRDSTYNTTLFFLLRKWTPQERRHSPQLNIRLVLHLLVLQEQHLPRILQALLPVSQQMIPERPKVTCSPAISIKCLWKRSEQLAVVEHHAIGLDSQHGTFWDHLLGYWKESSENPGKVLFLKYEEMKSEPDVQLRRMAAFLGCPFSEEEEEGGVVGGILRLCSFESLSSLEVNKTGKGLLLGNSNNVLFRKGKVGDWRNHLTDEMATRLNQIVEEKFKGTGLKL
nr:cytosolic sulfotransferase 12-like [Ipomoea batatas]